MDEAQLKAWLEDRGCSAPLVNSIIDTANQIRDVYRPLTGIGAAMDHNDWIEEITDIGRETDSDVDRLGWFLDAMTGALIAYVEQSE